jgi:hypothetical protein
MKKIIVKVRSIQVGYYYIEFTSQNCSCSVTGYKDKKNRTSIDWSCCGQVEVKEAKAF